MSVSHLVKVGLMGVVGRYESLDSNVYPRDTHVVCRTERGLEQGWVMTDLESSAEGSRGQLLRHVTPEDRLILERLEKHRDKAFHACQALIRESGIPAVLVDVEHLLDGESLFFYFLGDPDPRLESITDQLAATYDRKVRFKKFAETMAQGCGPDCGTGEGGCGSGGCGSCAIAGACGAASKK